MRCNAWALEYDIYAKPLPEVSSPWESIDRSTAQDVLCDRNVFGNYMREDFQPHTGKETSLNEFKTDGGRSMCTHLPQSVKSENGDYEIFYHIQDTPG